MTNDLYNDNMENIAINMTRYIHKSGKTAKATKIKEALASREENFNFSQIFMITSRIFAILKTINFLKKIEIKDTITDAALNDIYKETNYDLEILKIATGIMFGERKKTKIFALLKCPKKPR